MEDIQYVGFWARFRAVMIDVVLLLLIIYPVFFLIYGDAFIDKAADFSAINNLINYVFPLMATLILWHYKSATPGKMFIKATIVDATTYEKPTTKQFIIRYFAYLLSALPLGLGYFWAGWDKKKQTWHDKLAHTVVVQPKTEKECTTVLGYVARGFGILLIGLIIPLLVLGLMVEGGYLPDGDIYKADKLKTSVIQKLKDRNLINNAQELRYFQPDSLFSFTDSGIVITTAGISTFYTSDEGEVLNNYLAFKDMTDLKIDLIHDIMGMLMIEIYVYDKGEEPSLFAIVSTTKESFKNELMGLWKDGRDSK